jgi:hypothetical protein
MAASEGKTETYSHGYALMSISSGIPMNFWFADLEILIDGLDRTKAMARIFRLDRGYFYLKCEIRNACRHLDLPGKSLRKSGTHSRVGTELQPVVLWPLAEICVSLYNLSWS